MPIRLLLADDHPALLAGLKVVLASYSSDLQVIGEAYDSTELMEKLACTPCDVLVTDYAMPGGKFGDGVNMLSIVRRTYPELKILVFATMSNAAIAQKLSTMGINGMLNKADAMEHLVDAIRRTYYGGDFVFSPKLRADMETADAPAPDFAEKAKTLTVKEIEVLRLYLTGMSNDEIAKQLNRTKQTVSAQRLNAMKKLGAKNDVDLSQYAAEIGIATATEPKKLDTH
ncbi:response regulator [Ralstonia sp. R-29]|uniref:response regulator n=1 Tax=Ralstonia sp. R-29 TaxID=3404059 RepID=UPI003CECFED3